MRLNKSTFGKILLSDVDIQEINIVNHTKMIFTVLRRKISSIYLGENECGLFLNAHMNDAIEYIEFTDRLDVLP